MNTKTTSDPRTRAAIEASLIWLDIHERKEILPSWWVDKLAFQDDITWIIDIFLKEDAIIHLKDLILQYGNIPNLVYMNQQFRIHTGIEKYKKISEEESEKIKTLTKAIIDWLLKEINSRNSDDSSKSYTIYTPTEEESGYDHLSIYLARKCVDVNINTTQGHIDRLLNHIR